MRLPYVAAAALAVATGCGEDPEPPLQAWTLPVAESATVIRHPAPAEAERTARFRLVEDLVVGERGDDLDYLFGRFPPRVAPLPDGGMAVADWANRRVQIYDEAGEHAMTLGRAGQGPGEFSQPRWVQALPERLLVIDPANSRGSYWSVDGEHLRGVGLGARRGVRPLGAFELDWVGWLRQRGEAFDSGDYVIERLDGDMAVVHEYVRMPIVPRVIDPPRGVVPRTEPNGFYAGNVPAAAVVSSDGVVYASTLEHYQVLAFEPGGAMRWALQAPSTRPPLSRDEIEWLMGVHNQRFPDRRATDMTWPETSFFLGDIRVDGHGRLFVFPYVPRGTRVRSLDVDVYSPDGERLASGRLELPRVRLTWMGQWGAGPMLDLTWQAVAGEFVYGVQSNEQTGNWSVVRYRLESS